MTLTDFARAKINLTLHVTGQRDDGYHELDSLVMFASVGDHLELRTDQPRNLSLSGPEAAGVPTDASNSILKVADALLSNDAHAAFSLQKTLPAAAGIGGGTADAAAAIRLISWAYPGAWPNLDDVTEDRFRFAEVCQKALKFGADVPVCLMSRTARMRGVGEDVQVLSGLPILHAVLINPRVSVSTPAIFKAMENKNNSPMPDQIPTFSDAKKLITWLANQRNDMQAAACAFAPEIDQTLEALRAQPGCLLARMSGSGATCFGLFETADAKAISAIALRKAHPDWWVHPCTLGDG